MKTHVTNLELSKRLKELGFPQKSEFYHYSRHIHYGKLQAITDEAQTSAYLASELGEWLPQFPEGELVDIVPTLTIGHKWRVDLTDEGTLCVEDNECNARAKMLIHLAEKGIINPKEL